MNLTKDVKCLLTAAGITDPIFRSYLPDGDDVPDDVVVLYEYAGLPSNSLDSRFFGYSLQVVTRSRSFDAGLERANSISNILKDIGNSQIGREPVAVNHTLYFRFAALQTPFKLKEDEQRRIYFTQNFRVYARTILKEE